MLPDLDLEVDAVRPCAAVDDPLTADLAWLMHRAGKVLANDFDAICQRFGLSDRRDCLVLAVISDGSARTQIEIARTLDIDKTTLMSILDGLEREGHVVRTTSPTNRRIRIPGATPQGLSVLAKVMDARDAAVNERLGLLRDGESEVLRVALWRLANAPLGLSVAVADSQTVGVAQPEP